MLEGTSGRTLALRTGEARLPRLSPFSDLATVGFVAPVAVSSPSLPSRSLVLDEIFRGLNRPENVILPQVQGDCAFTISGHRYLRHDWDPITTVRLWQRSGLCRNESTGKAWEQRWREAGDMGAYTEQRIKGQRLGRKAADRSW